MQIFYCVYHDLRGVLTLCEIIAKDISIAFDEVVKYYDGKNHQVFDQLTTAIEHFKMRK
jgi:hypothetical protein